jgi:hypothetical protein
MFDIMLIERWNQRLFGFNPRKDPEDASPIVDQMLFMFGANAIDKLLDMLDTLPESVLIGKLCPRGMEAQVFANLVSLYNFGTALAGINGSIVAGLLGIELHITEKHVDDKSLDKWECTNPELWLGISALAWLKFISNFVLPLCTIPFTWMCLPDAYLDDDLLGEGDDEGDDQGDAEQNRSNADYQTFGPSTQIFAQGDEHRGSQTTLRSRKSFASSRGSMIRVGGNTTIL